MKKVSLNFNIKKITESVVTYFRHRKETLSFFGTNHYVDWTVLLLALCLITLAGVIGAGLLFFDVNKGEDAYAISPGSMHQELINKDMITHIIGQYTMKEGKLNSLINAGEPYRDPSL